MPTSAFAAVKIVDVMYDPPGADAGHEWIEVTNTGPDAVNLTTYRLFEGGVNHKLAAATGAASLAAGAKAIITTDPAQYAADNPGFSGSVFKSSFSLSNTAETISLKDAKLTTVDTYSYTAPPVVKAAAPVKAPKAVKAPKVKTTKATKMSTPYIGASQSAAVSLANLPQLPAIPRLWLYGLGLATLLLLCAAATVYAWPVTPTLATSGPSEEFELE